MNEIDPITAHAIGIVSDLLKSWNVHYVPGVNHGRLCIHIQGGREIDTDDITARMVAALKELQAASQVLCDRVRAATEPAPSTDNTATTKRSPTADE